MKNNFFIILITLRLLSVAVPGYSQEYTMPSFVHAIDACDMDMDGSIDIIASCAYEDSIVILFNDGYGNFEPYYYIRNTQHLLCGCIDNDSIPDLITFTEGYIYFIKNNGNRLLDEGDVVMELGATFPFDRIIDMNNDGWNDIFYQNQLDMYLGIYKNNGDLSFSNKIIYSDYTSKPCLGDLNSDNLPDIVISFPNPVSDTKVYLNNGNFNFSTSEVLDMVIADPIIMELNDSIPQDLALFETPTPNVYFFKNLGNSSFQFMGNNPLINASGVVFNNYNDYDRDGFGDICYSHCYITGCNDSIYVSLNSQNWSFELASPYFIGTLNWFRINSADLNGDNYPDFYMTGYNGNNTIKILWNNGNRTFSYLNPVGIIDKIVEFESIIKVNPNPFIDFSIITINSNEIADLNITIYDNFGRRIRGFHSEAWKSSFIWDGTDDSGHTCPSGIYLIVVEVDKHRNFTKVVKR